MKKVVVILVVFVLAFGFAGCAVAYTSSEPCAWCSNTPTKQIASEMTDTEAYYYCEECSTNCVFCRDTKATNHYTNLLGLEVFVCDECYTEVTEN